MSTALYRRYRPETFTDVIGQEHVTEPLMQALKTGRINHAYLFSGPRGCGKTTSARILARCLNCEQGPTPEPCGICESCVALARGGAGSVDVIEIDAASHGGVEDARDLRERASFGPAGSRYKIYIIDEAHMVTPQGFNALLKIVEEPPEHVKFVFATTEPEKVIGTIRSRTHHYPFRLVPPKKLTDYLERLLQAEDVAYEPGVLSFVTRAGGGSVRDSLSILDQLIAGSGSDGLTYGLAAGLLGFTDDELLDGIVEAFAANDGAAVFRQIERVVEAGADPRRFVEDLLERLRDLIIVAAVEDGAAAVLRTVPADQLERMQQQAASFGAGGLSRAADVINAGLTEMTGATSPRLQLELMCARVLLPGMAGADGYAARLDRMERRLEMGELPRGAGVGPVPHAPASPPAEASAPAPHLAQQVQERETRREPASLPTAAEPRGEEAPQAVSNAWDEEPAARSPKSERQQEGPQQVSPEAEPESPRPASAVNSGMTTDEIRRLWTDVLDRVFRIKRATWTLISQNAQVAEFDGERLVLGAATEGLAAAMSRGQHPEVVRQALVEAVGIDVRVEARAVRLDALTTAAAAPGAPSASPGDTSGGHSESPRWGRDAVRRTEQETAPERIRPAVSQGVDSSVREVSSTDVSHANPVPREAETPEQDAGLQAAAARSSAWASDSPGDWAAQTTSAPEWASEGGAAAEPVSSAVSVSASSSPQPAVDEEPPPDPLAETPPWMEDEPETDAEAVYDPLPPKQDVSHGLTAEVAETTTSASRESSSRSAQEAAQLSERNLTPRQRAEKAAREHAQRDEDARRGRALDDAEASPDDEDIENSDSVGLPVIKSVLGGTVIKEEGPSEGA